MAHVDDDRAPSPLSLITKPRSAYEYCFSLVYDGASRMGAGLITLVYAGFSRWVTRKQHRGTHCGTEGPLAHPAVRRLAKRVLEATH